MMINSAKEEKRERTRGKMKKDPLNIIYFIKYNEYERIIEIFINNGDTFSKNIQDYFSK